MLERIFRATVWHRDGVREEDRRFQAFFRIVLPLMDIALIVFGLASWHLGLRSLLETTGATVQSWLSLGIAISAAVALVGVSFPRWPRVELAGKVPLIALLAFYLAVLVIRGFDDALVAAASAILIIPILIAWWRISDLGFVRWARKRGQI